MKSEITEMTSKDRVNPMYEAKFLNGLREFIIFDSDQPIDSSRTQVAETETQVNLKQYELEQRINKLKKAIEQLYDLIS